MGGLLVVAAALTELLPICTNHEHDGLGALLAGRSFIAPPRNEFELLDEVVDHLNGMVNVKYIGQRLAPRLAQQQAAYASIPDLHNYVGWRDAFELR